MKVYSLKRKKDFAATLNHGKKIVKKFFVFFYSNKENQSDIKLGVIASKKMLRLATQRNKAKRRLKAAFAQAVKASNPDIRGNFVLIARGGLITEKLGNIVDALGEVVHEL